MSSTAVQDTVNYLVPSSGNTHAVEVSGVFSGVPQTGDWRQFGIDSFPFQPQGVFIDNTYGVGPLTITIAPLNWNIVCPAGAQKSANFPAPNGQSYSIVGDGQATCIF